MQQMAFWKYWLLIALLGSSQLATPARSQQPAHAPAPSPGADAKSWVDFGISNAANGDLDAALGAFDQAIQINPKYAPAYFCRGKAHAQQQKPDEAIADFNQAIQLDPADTEAYYQRGSLKGQKGDFDGAAGDFSQVIKLDPKYAPAYYNLGHVYYFQGKLDGALDEINQALSLDPNFSYCYFIRGLIRHAQEHREEALSDFQKSAGFNFPYAAYWVWITETENGQRGLARQDLSNALAKPESFKPDDWPSQIANFLLEKITQDQLLAQAKTGANAESNSRLCEAWFYIGMAKRLSGDTKGAPDCFAKAMATGAKGSEEYVEANRQAAVPPTP